MRRSYVARERTSSWSERGARSFSADRPMTCRTNIRNVKSKHWTRWLGPEQRCVVPFNSLSEFNKAEGGDIWFALDETRPLACFAGIWTS
jgi:putative SOS response-associated peptidase YedK